MTRLIILLIASLLPVMAALTLFGVMQAWAVPHKAFPMAEAQMVRHLELGLIRSY